MALKERVSLADTRVTKSGTNNAQNGAMLLSLLKWTINGCRALCPNGGPRVLCMLMVVILMDAKPVLCRHTLKKPSRSLLPSPDHPTLPAPEFTIHYNETEATIRTHPSGHPLPATLIDLSQKRFVYITKTNCYVGNFGGRGLGDIERRTKKGSAGSRWTGTDIAALLAMVHRGSLTYYATTQTVPNAQLHKLLRSNLGSNECKNRKVRWLTKTKPKLPTFEEFRRSYERNRTREVAGSQVERRGLPRNRRSAKRPSRRRGNRSSAHSQLRKRRQRKNRRKNAYQQDPSLNPVIIADDTPYNSPSFTRNPQGRSGFRHYGDFYNEQDSANGHLNTNEPNEPQFSGTNSSNLNSKFPDTIFKDGKVFYRHDVQEQNNEQKITTRDQADSPKISQNAYQDMSFQGVQNSNVGTGSSRSMTRSFDMLMDHVRNVGSQGNIISAAIAGASVRGSKEGSTSHVIGSAINGGYFAASAQGYDGKGGTVQSHIHGTADGVGGGASAVAPDRDGEAFIQVDHSERGLSIGQSSAHNGEAFVIADIDSESENQIKYGDSTSSYYDKYNTKTYGHTFGEARSHIYPTKPKMEDEHNESERKLGLNQVPYDQRPVTTNIIGGIMEKVHHPDMSPTFSTTKENDYFIEEYPTTENKYRTGYNTNEDLLTTSGTAPKNDVKSSKTQEKEGVVGRVTFPYGQVGTPPGPGELLTQTLESVSLSPLGLNNADELYTDYYGNTAERYPTQHLIDQNNITSLFNSTVPSNPDYINPNHLNKFNHENFYEHTVSPNEKNTNYNMFDLTNFNHLQQSPNVNYYSSQWSQNNFNDGSSVDSNTKDNVYPQYYPHDNADNGYDDNNFNSQHYSSNNFYPTGGNNYGVDNYDYRTHESGISDIHSGDPPKVQFSDYNNNLQYYSSENVPISNEFGFNIFNNKPTFLGVRKSSVNGPHDFYGSNRQMYASSAPTEDHYNIEDIESQLQHIAQSPVSEELDKKFGRQPASPDKNKFSVEEQLNGNNYDLQNGSPEPFANSRNFDQRQFLPETTRSSSGDYIDINNFENQSYIPEEDEYIVDKKLNNNNTSDYHLYSSLDNQFNPKIFNQHSSSSGVKSSFEGNYDSTYFLPDNTNHVVEDEIYTPDNNIHHEYKFNNNNNNFEGKFYDSSNTFSSIDNNFDRKTNDSDIKYPSHDYGSYLSNRTDHSIDGSIDFNNSYYTPYLTVTRLPSVSNQYDYNKFDKKPYLLSITQSTVDDKIYPHLPEITKSTKNSQFEGNFENTPFFSMTQKSPNDNKLSNNNYNHQIKVQNISQPDIVPTSKPFPNRDQFNIDEQTHDPFNVRFENENIDHHSYIPENTQHLTEMPPVNSDFPRDTLRPNEMGRQSRVIPPGKIGSTQRLDPSAPGEPVINVHTIDKSDKRKLTYDQKGTAVGPGENIPGIPWYRVPTGFRGRVVFDSSIPVQEHFNKEISQYQTSKYSPIEDYNQRGRTKLYPQVPQARKLFYNARHGAQQQPLVNHSPLNRDQTFRNPTKNSWDRTTKSNTSKSYSTNSNTKSQDKSWNSKRNRQHGQTQNLGHSKEACGYYTHNCETMYGPYQNSNICTPTFIAVQCCC